MEISLVLGLVATISIIANFIVFRLALWQSRKLADVSDNLGDLVEIINSYKDHLKNVYELDSFYGDKTLEGLMSHTNAVRLLLEEQYGEVINITEPIEYEIEEVNEDGEKEVPEKEKHVLYAGTRRRDS